LCPLLRQSTGRPGEEDEEKELRQWKTQQPSERDKRSYCNFAVSSKKPSLIKIPLSIVFLVPYFAFCLFSYCEKRRELFSKLII